MSTSTRPLVPAGQVESDPTTTRHVVYIHPSLRLRRGITWFGRFLAITVVRKPCAADRQHAGSQQLRAVVTALLL
jgi:hypothetical protein